MPKKKKRASICMPRKHAWSKNKIEIEIVSDPDQVTYEAVATKQDSQTQILNDRIDHNYYFNGSDISDEEHQDIMPKKKRRASVCVPRKRGWCKKNIELEKTSDPDQETSAAVTTKQDSQTQTLNDRIDHSYCLYGSDISDEEHQVNMSNKTLITTFIEQKDILNDGLVEDPSVLHTCEVKTTELSSMAADVKNSINKNFTVMETDNKLCILKLYTESTAVMLSIELKNDLSCYVYVHRKLVPKSHPIWKNVEDISDPVNTLLELCRRVERYSVCCGSYEEEFLPLVPVGSGISNNSSACIAAYREGDFGSDEYASTIRSVKCEFLVEKGRCRECASYRKTLRKRKYRNQEDQNAERSYNHTTYKHSDMSREKLIKKLNEQKEEIDTLQNTVCKLKRQYQKAIKKHGVDVKKTRT